MLFEVLTDIDAGKYLAYNYLANRQFGELDALFMRTPNTVEMKLLEAECSLNCTEIEMHS